MTECNVKNRTIFCDDNLDILQGINSECIDLIYLDPPFNKNKKFTAPIGTSAEGASFKDIFTQDDLKEGWLKTLEENQSDLFRYLSGIRGIGKPYNFAYLAYMAIRLLECHRVLKPTGSIYLHCDATMSHYLKTTMDCIFGEDNYRNEITWHRSRGKGLNPKRYVSNCDTILYYTRSKTRTWNQQYVPFGADYGKDWKKDDLGYWQSADLTGGKAGGPSAYLPFKGVLPASGRAWAPPVRGKFPPEAQRRLPGNYKKLDQLKKCEALDTAGLIHWPDKAGGKPCYKKYLSMLKGLYVSDLFADIPPISPQAAERTGYPTQKPLALLKRIIQASNNPGDMVLDPFCGCATTCVAAEDLNRQWIGIDISVKAYELVKQRLTKEVADPSHLFKSQNTIHMRTDPPKRTDQGADYQEQKFVYVISHPNFPGEYKVGIAKDWASRLNSYQTSDPDRQYKLEFKFETPRFRETESHIHEKFENKHEWVNANLKDIIDEIKSYNSV